MKPLGNLFEKQLTNLRQRQELLAILIFSLVTCLVWVTIDLVTSQQRTSISPELQRLALPLNPTINQETINELQQKRNYEESELSSFPIYRVVSAKDRAAQLRQQASGTTTPPATSLETLTSTFLDEEPQPSEASDSGETSSSLTDTAPPPDTATSSSDALLPPTTSGGEEGIVQ